ncbi:MAG: phosphatase PAP2 family protein [Planctomycetes bacterium]|nr:phosphatase PAP2 family protein [Planctomycetota bacterium]
MREFLARRLSRKDYLGLHLAVGLLLSVMMAVAFALVARQVDTAGALTEVDAAVGQRLAEHRASGPVVRAVLIGLTLLGASDVLLVLVPIGGVGFWLCHRRLLAVVWLLAGTGSSLINTALKHSFGRPRPPWKDSWVYEANESFPSGHSSASIVLLGFLAYVAVRTCPRRVVRVILFAGAVVLILAIGFSRVYLGAHYFSDVVGGYCIGAAWLTACVTAFESVRMRLSPTRQRGSL